MDYVERAALRVHDDWETFERWRISENRRLIVLSTKAGIPYTEYSFTSGDCLLFGRESGGVPDNVVKSADASLTIPMVETGRSLNVAISASIVLGEALRQTNNFADQAG